MSGKSGKIEELTAKYRNFGWRAHYLGFFDCFNRQDYYDAHDVLEELWLKDGRFALNFAFYQGLIQCAGAVVHLQQHYLDPLHRAHSQRLGPACRLLRLCRDNLRVYPDIHEQLDLRTVRNLCRHYAGELRQGGFCRNPWTPVRAPRLHLLVSY